MRTIGAIILVAAVAVAAFVAGPVAKSSTVRQRLLRARLCKLHRERRS